MQRFGTRICRGGYSDWNKIYSSSFKTQGGNIFEISLTFLKTLFRSKLEKIHLNENIAEWHFKLAC